MVGYMNVMTDMSGEPVSRTHQYRKVMKPLLERKRRARINRCLDELKDLMTSTFQADGENVAKLEKADILELTVRHLQKIQHQKSARPETTYADKFKAGFRQCAAEVTQFLVHVDQGTSAHMLHHLSDCIKQLETLPGAAAAPPMPVQPTTPPTHRYAQSLDSQEDDQDMYEDEDDFDEAPARQASPSAVHRHQQQQQPQQQQHHHQNIAQQMHEMHHRINTPPQSPEVDIDGEELPVWRPW